MAVATGEPYLRLPGDHPDRFRQMRRTLVDDPRYPCREAIGPGGFDQGRTRQAVAGLGDGPATDGSATRIFLTTPGPDSPSADVDCRTDRSSRSRRPGSRHSAWRRHDAPAKPRPPAPASSLATDWRARQQGERRRINSRIASWASSGTQMASAGQIVGSGPMSSHRADRS